MLGIFVATFFEAVSIKPRYFKPHKLYKLTPSIILYIGGMGENNALKAMKILKTNGATSILSWGMCAAIAPNLKPGDIIMPNIIQDQNLSQYNQNTDYVNNIKSNKLQNIKIYTDPLLHSSKIIYTPENKSKLFNKYQAIAIDQESFPIAMFCTKARLNYFCIRSVFDAQNYALPETIFSLNNIILLPSLIANYFKATKALKSMSRLIINA